MSTVLHESTARKIQAKTMPNEPHCQVEKVAESHLFLLFPRRKEETCTNTYPVGGFVCRLPGGLVRLSRRSRLGSTRRLFASHFKALRGSNLLKPPSTWHCVSLYESRIEKTLEGVVPYGSRLEILLRMVVT